MSTFLQPLLALALLSLFVPPSLAAICRAQSGGTTVALLELYTSEGCDSCPPADRWIAALPQRGFTRDRIVPIALHVDYWNSLGWTDRFSQSAFTQRQRDLVRRTNGHVVYTPQFLLSGRDYRGWLGNGLASDLERINRISPRANIELQLARRGQTLQIDAKTTIKQAEPTALYLALYENDLRSDVRAGENRGRILEHAVVVRQLLGPFRFEGAGSHRINEVVALESEWRPHKLGVAAFIQESNGTDVLQALALDLCR